MSFSPTEKEIQCVVNWFKAFTFYQKKDFYKQLLDKAVPCNMDNLFESLGNMNVEDRPPSIFQCQMKLFNQWFDGWSDSERNDFITKLRAVNPQFVEEFEKELALHMSGQNNT